MSSPPRLDPPIFWIFAGPNGSGKSSAYQNADFEAVGRSVWIINPDLLAARIAEVEAMTLPAANLQAVIRIEAWLEASIAAHQTVGVETVLSTPKYQRLLRAAQERGFLVYLTYVILDRVERNIERVRARVEKGGHAVPEEKIRERYQKSLHQLPWFLERADRAWIYNNSTSRLKLMGLKEDGVVTLSPDALSSIHDAVSSIAQNEREA